MGYVFMVRLASFLAGAAGASFFGMYVLHNDYKVAHEAVSRQTISGYLINGIKVLIPCNGLHDTFDRRISELEKLKQAETTRHVEATE